MSIENEENEIDKNIIIKELDGLFEVVDPLKKVFFDEMFKYLMACEEVEIKIEKICNPNLLHVDPRTFDNIILFYEKYLWVCKGLTRSFGDSISDTESFLKQMKKIKEENIQ